MAAQAQELKPSGTIQLIQGISEKPFFRQVALMVGIAASVALGVAVILWSQNPEYILLSDQIPSEQMAEMEQSLKQKGIDYQMDAVNGRILVSAPDLNRAKILLSSQGLHKITPKGFEILNQEQSFGTSQFIQNARYHKALEEELALSIASLRNVKNARVHLALPKQSVFVRDRKQASASVVLHLLSGHTLSEEQVLAISNMVSSSVEGLTSDNVSIVDQLGRLLTSKEDQDRFGMNDKQMKYTQQLESNLNEKVSRILTPFLGKDGFSVEVKADLDFNRKEVTAEQYNPDLSAIRSKQQLVEKSTGGGQSGVPGSLSNQPPGGSIVPETSTGIANATQKRSRSSESLTENYEVDKSISHVQYSTGMIKQLSVAVVVDDKRSANEEGEIQTTPRSAEEISRITALVKEAVGYNIQRGDTVNVLNAAFVAPEEMAPLPEVAIWEQSWFMGAVKQLLAALFVLYLLFGIIKPAFKNLSKPYTEAGMAGSDSEKVNALAGVAAGEDGADGKGVPAIGPDGKPIALPGQPKLDADGNALPTPEDIYQMELDLAKKLVNDDPKVAAQLVKGWLRG